jgi:hypothetical protein
MKHRRKYIMENKQFGNYSACCRVYMPVRADGFMKRFLYVTRSGQYKIKGKM